MNMHWVDWAIVLVLGALGPAAVLATRKHTQSVADFLAGGRSAGRYLLSISTEITSTGAVSVVALFEMYYDGGFVPAWWGLTWWFVGLVIALSGWVVYRFRQTRAMTMAQFLEMRYSKRFRIFAGMVAFVAGVVNFGIFPAVGARFFIYFCGLPDHFRIWHLQLEAFPCAMAILIGISLFLTLAGGQIAVILTDFVHGTVFSVVLLITVVSVMRMCGWSRIIESLVSSPKSDSLLHPFRPGGTESFDAGFFLIGAFGLFYNHLSWQGMQGFNCCAKSPHEARIGRLLFTSRVFIERSLIMLVAIAVFALLHHPDFASQAAGIRTALAGIDAPQIQTQMTVPLALGRVLPTGLMGGFCAMMLAAFISTNDTYLHSWGSILIQDVIMPFRKKPLTPRQHLTLLRCSIAGVAIVIFFFSLFFRHTQYIFMFFAITGAIYLGGSGAVIVGGLYWKRGTTAAAWASMIVGSTLAVSGFIVTATRPGFPLTGQEMYFIAMASAILVYVIVSLLGRRSEANMNQILHRGRYSAEGESNMRTAAASKVKSLLGLGAEFSRGDVCIYFAAIAWTALWFLVFVSGTVLGAIFNTRTGAWAMFWRWYAWLTLSAGVVTAVWFLIGGLHDLKDMFGRLKSSVRDHTDDGRVGTRSAETLQPPVDAPTHGRSE